eukprot:3332419-Amphidinium_carterae.2
MSLSMVSLATLRATVPALELKKHTKPLTMDCNSEDPQGDGKYSVSICVRAHGQLSCDCCVGILDSHQKALHELEVFAGGFVEAIAIDARLVFGGLWTLLRALYGSFGVALGTRLNVDETHCQ